MESFNIYSRYFWETSDQYPSGKRQSFCAGWLSHSEVYNSEPTHQSAAKKGPVNRYTTHTHKNLHTSDLKCC
jgi:hypothetical protein